jgi:plasmid stabilization system protein ParE
MPASVIWRRRAENHLQAIYDYISLENPHAASAYAEDIVAASERLRTFPKSGRKFDSRYRVLVARNHLIFYHHDADQSLVSIVAIIDGRRDVMAALDDPSDAEE